jgi:hypothetical protein
MDLILSEIESRIGKWLFSYILSMSPDDLDIGKGGAVPSLDEAFCRNIFRFHKVVVEVLRKKSSLDLQKWLQSRNHRFNENSIAQALHADFALNLSEFEEVAREFAASRSEI